MSNNLLIEEIFGTLRQPYIGVSVGADETGGVIAVPYIQHIRRIDLLSELVISDYDTLYFKNL